MDNQRVQNGFVDGRNEAVGLHSEQNQASTTGLFILPVKVKAKGFDQMIQTYAFLDNGSNASSCSEELANQLNLSGKEDHTVVNDYGKGEQQDRLSCC